MISADTIASVHETSARSDAAYAPSVDIPFIVGGAGESARKWPPAPGELVSLLDILRFNANDFVNLMKILDTLGCCLLEWEKEIGGMIDKTIEDAAKELNVDVKQVPEEELLHYHKEHAPRLRRSLWEEGLAGYVKSAEDHCRSLLLTSAVKHIERMRQQFSSGDIVLADLKAFFVGLTQRIDEQLSEEIFLHLPRQRTYYWSEEPLFSEKAQRRFRKAVDDMVEAGKCLALGRFTACVFHLTRVVEIGAKRFAKRLPGLSLSHKATLGAIAKGISDEVVNMPNATPQETARKEEFSRIADHLSHFTAGWRNKTNHPGLSYNEEQATLMFQNVREFMQRLADLK
jgi:hypothetical protein